MLKNSDSGLMSMTGFASASGALDEWTWAVDIRSVNGRGLDLRMRLPDWIEGLESEVRKLCQARLSRGNVTVNLKLQRAVDAAALTLNTAALAAAIDALDQIEKAADASGLALTPPSAADIAHMRGIMEVNESSDIPDVAPLRTAILETMTGALAAFQDNRASEGTALGAVLGEQIDRIESLAADASAALGSREEAARAAMKRSLSRLLENSDMPDEARLLQELALIAVKTDVTEELDRLTAHIAAARALLGETGPRGRKFDFLMQEFNREANTLCSKSQSTELTAIGLDLKAVIDQMREQVQNVE